MEKAEKSLQRVGGARLSSNDRPGCAIGEGTIVTLRRPCVSQSHVPHTIALVRVPERGHHEGSHASLHGSHFVTKRIHAGF